MKKILFIIAALMCLISCTKTNQPSVENKSDFLDLTKMSSTMIFSNVFNMMLEPESFEGKTVKCSGWFAAMKGPHEEDVYSVIVPDATKCCQQGIGFLYDFGEKLPQINQTITVTGTFILEELEDGITWSYLKAETVEF